MKAARMPNLVVGVGLVLALASCGSDGSEGGSAPARSTTSTTTASSTTTSTTVASTTTSAGAVVPPDGYPPDRVVLTCDGTDATLSTDAVLTQPDGIHVVVQNTTDDEVSLNLAQGGDLVPPGETETVQELKPATLAISCGYDLNRTILPAGTVEVRDPDGNWRPTDIDCTKLPLARWEEPLGSGATPEEAIRWWMANRPRDLVQPAGPDDELVVVGYPEAKAPRYVLRRDGHDTNIFHVTRQADGTWQALPHEYCPR